jgi:hypothetical protein
MATENAGGTQAEDARTLIESASRSMRESSGVVQTVEQLAARLAASGNEQAAASEQVRSSIESVAASVEDFQAKYPGVNNVVGGWAGQLSNTDEEIELETVTGEEVDLVHYADEGDWAIRQRGPLDLNSRGWEWFSAADGTNFNTAANALQGGRSLELRNPALPNEFGQNWTASSVSNGTPGVVNSAATKLIHSVCQRMSATDASAAVSF